VEVSCRIQWIHFNVFVDHFWHPEVIKMQSQKAKITEPDRIIFLENQDELAPPLFLHTLSVVLFFIVQNKPHYKVKITPTIKIGWITY
jgi:hypothetical protein